MASAGEVRGWIRDGSFLRRLYDETLIFQLRGQRVIAHPPRWIRFVQNRDQVLARLVEVVVSLREAEEDKENCPSNGQTGQTGFPSTVVARRVGSVR